VTPTPLRPPAHAWQAYCGAALLGLACLGSTHLYGQATTTTSVAASAPAPQASTPAPATALAPLRLDLPPMRLPEAATVGRPYSYKFEASGGQSPYQYSVKGTPLPEGMALDAQGRLSGTAKAANTYTITISVSDALQQQAQQSFSLRVLLPGPAKAASAASNPAAPPIKTLSPDAAQALVPAPWRAQLDVFKLQAATLELLVPTPGPAEEAALLRAADKQAEEDRANGVLVEAPLPANPANTASAPSAPAKALPPAPGPLTPEHIAQLTQLLTPLLNVEYPNQQLFEAALDAQLCQFTADLISANAAKQGRTPPSKQDFAKDCPPSDWNSRLAKAQAQRALGHAGTPPSASASISLKELAPSIMPPELRAWLVQSSRSTQTLNFDKKIAWDGKGCGCVQEEILSQVYGFFPGWWATGTPQKVDFSRITRASVFAIAFNEDGGLELPELEDPGFADFVQQARVHGTALDLTLYRNDWEFLRKPDAKEREATIARMVRQVPANALGLIDRKLGGWKSRLFGVLPNLANSVQMGDGITLYLDQVPHAHDQPARQRFDAFYQQLVEALIATLRQGPHNYTLNLVMSDQDIATPGAFAADKLLDYLRQAENPTLRHGRIEDLSAHYQTNTNLTLRYIVTLSEPTTDSKKALRAKLDQSSALHGDDRRIFMRKLIAMVSPRSTGGPQFAADLVYFEDNFGGVALWTLPVEGLSTPSDYVQNFDTAFLSTPVNPVYRAVRGWVCEHRWPLRATFDLLLLVGAVGGAAMALNCAWRSRWGRYLPLYAIAPLIVGAVLFTFDPALKPLRESHVFLWVLIAIVALWAVLAMRKTHVEKP